MTIPKFALYTCSHSK